MTPEERARVAQRDYTGAIDRDLSAGQRFIKIVTDAIREAEAAARHEEREACLALVERFIPVPALEGAAVRVAVDAIAAAIRAREEG